MSNITVSAVPTPLLDVLWADVEPLLNAAIDTNNGRYTTESVRAAILSSELALWVAMDGVRPIAALTTRICEYPTGLRGLCIDWIGGTRMSEWLPVAQPLMAEYARDNNCAHLEGYGRRAWGRVLGRYGWEPEYTAYRMELSDG